MGKITTFFKKLSPGKLLTARKEEDGLPPAARGRNRSATATSAAALHDVHQADELPPEEFHDSRHEPPAAFSATSWTRGRTVVEYADTVPPELEGEIFIVGLPDEIDSVPCFAKFDVADWNTTLAGFETGVAEFGTIYPLQGDDLPTTLEPIINLVTGSSVASGGELRHVVSRLQGSGCVCRLHSDSPNRDFDTSCLVRGGTDGSGGSIDFIYPDQPSKILRIRLTKPGIIIMSRVAAGIDPPAVGQQRVLHGVAADATPPRHWLSSTVIELKGAQPVTVAGQLVLAVSTVAAGLEAAAAAGSSSSGGIVGGPAAATRSAGMVAGPSSIVQLEQPPAPWPASNYAKICSLKGKLRQRQIAAARVKKARGEKLTQQEERDAVHHEHAGKTDASEAVKKNWADPNQTKWGNAGSADHPVGTDNRKGKYTSTAGGSLSTKDGKATGGATTGPTKNRGVSSGLHDDGSNHGATKQKGRSKVELIVRLWSGTGQVRFGQYDTVEQMKEVAALVWAYAEDPQPTSALSSDFKAKVDVQRGLKAPGAGLLRK